MKMRILLVLGALWAVHKLTRSARKPTLQEPAVPAPTPPNPGRPTDDAPSGMYRDRFGKLTPLGCVRDRYGIVYEKNPNGFGRRELGSGPDEPYWVRRLD